jgi:shikimate kinase
VVEVTTGRPVVVLIGAPGAGKTRIGKRVARLMRVPFVDTDALIVAEHGEISEIFAMHGEPHFRVLERKHVALALTENAVVSLGGGAILDLDTQADLRDLPVVQLTVSEDVIMARGISAKRPLLAGGIDAWRALVAARQETYDRLAGTTFDTSDQSANRIAERIVAWIQEGRE